jgi:hypothetical protein
MMPDIGPWIEHLNKPLVLMGFVLFVVAGLVKHFKPGELSKEVRKHLLNQIVLFACVLGILIGNNRGNNRGQTTFFAPYPSPTENGGMIY